MGTIAGIAGIEHGLGEILQGNVTSNELVFTSWPNSEMFADMAGEPAMSLIPNMLVSGFLSVFLSLVFIYWAIKQVHHRQYGIGFLVLSFLLLLVGGGFGPPLLGTILGVVTLCTRHYQKNVEGFKENLFLQQFGYSWKILFFITLVLWLFLFPVFPILSLLFHIHNGNIVAIVTPSAFLFLALSYISAGVWHKTYSFKSGSK